ncbi:MAG: TlpA disulfide reductase family protein [Anaerolineales bacterium]|nr:TlpA disulfide reductase family protein [Anaerolineales bacterium]
MKTQNKFFSSMLLMAVALTACGGTSTPEAMMDKETPTADAMMDKETPTADAMMSKETPTADAMMNKETPAADAMMEAPAWYSASLTDASTGQVFTINDFKGKVVLVETLAMWCSNCKQQQGQVKALHTLLGERDDFVSLGLDIDLNENSADLKGYVESNGFDWLYAVATADVAREFSKLYGDQFLNPPSTPMLVIDRHGEAHPLPFGIKSADELLKFIQPFLDGTM